MLIQLLTIPQELTYSRSPVNLGLGPKRLERRILFVDIIGFHQSRKLLNRPKQPRQFHKNALLYFLTMDTNGGGIHRFFTVLEPNPSINWSQYEQTIGEQSGNSVMEKQESGSLINISSIAAISSTPMLAYRSSKAGMNAVTKTIATEHAKNGIRANAIMPGLMNTPMAIEGLSRALGMDKQELISRRDKRVPLKGGMGDAWDVAYAALFLASDEAKFISGVLLPVDGAQSSRVG